VSKGKGISVILLEFRSLSISPIQRFPKYILIIETILKRMEKDHPLYNQVEEALDKVDLFCQTINSHRANVKFILIIYFFF
jgi:hypothetical protein